MDFKNFFTKGFHGTLRLTNNTQFSYKNNWKQVYNNTVLDEWHVGDFASAEYTIVVDHNRADKEVVKAIVVASPNDAGITVFARSSTGDELIRVNAEVDLSTFKLLVSPSQPSKAGARVMFSATYYQNLTD